MPEVSPHDVACIMKGTYEPPEGFVEDDPYLDLAKIRVGMHLAPEAQCEASNDILELVSYCVVYRWTDGRGEAFVGSRQPDAGEERLHGNRFLGWGGHIERQDVQDEPCSPFDCGATRELCEELEITGSSPHYEGTIYYPHDDVGQDHLGLAFSVRASEAKVREVEKYGEGEWLSVNELESEEFEPWSRLLIPHL